MDRASHHLRRGPFYEQFASRGAVFAESSGWSYPSWYKTPETPGYNEALKHEQHLVRNVVGVIDFSMLAYVLVQGPAAPDVVNRLSTCDLDVSVGQCRYAFWCDEQGQIIADGIVARVADQQFLAAFDDTRQSSAVTAARQCIDELGVSAEAIDFTSALSCLVVAGPSARLVLQGLVDADVSGVAFPPRTAQRFNVAGIPVLVMRISYVGELCFELHVATE